MAYTKTTWNNNLPPSINATNLNNIETGIDNLNTGVDSAGNALKLGGLLPSVFAQVNVANVFTENQKITKSNPVLQIIAGNTENADLMLNETVDTNGGIVRFNGTTNTIDIVALNGGVETIVYSIPRTTGVQDFKFEPTVNGDTIYHKGNQLLQSTVAVTNSGWLASGWSRFPFEKTTTLSGLTASDKLDLEYATTSDDDVGTTANLSARIDPATNAFTIYASVVPSTTITFDYLITKG